MRLQQLIIIILCIYECISINELPIHYRINGDVQSIDVDSGGTIGELHEIIKRQESIESFTLTLSGRTLNDETQLLSDAGLSSEVVIDVTVKIFEMVFQEYQYTGGSMLGGLITSNVRKVTMQKHQDITPQIIDSFPRFNNSNRWHLRDSNGQPACLFYQSNAVTDLEDAEIVLVPINSQLYPPLLKSTTLSMVFYNIHYSDYTDDRMCGDYGVYKPRDAYDQYWTELVLRSSYRNDDVVWISKPPDGYEFLLRKRSE